MKNPVEQLTKLGKCMMMSASLALAGSAGAFAQTCGGTYVVQQGDTLSAIANRQYKDVKKWSAIFQFNTDTVKTPNSIYVGQPLNMPCIAGLPVGLVGGVDPASVETVAARLEVPEGTGPKIGRINIVTGDDRLPWSDRDLPSGGMMTELVTAAMDAELHDGGYAIHWVNDWAAHLEPLLSNALVDVGFPWYKPDCASQPETYRCKNLIFSEPVFEVLVLLFVRSDDGFALNEDADIHGKTLCRPKAAATFFLDKDGRNWLKDEKVKLVQPIQSDDCFQMLVDGDVDAVVLNEFHGRKAVVELGLQEQISVAGGQPIAIQGLHVVAHKDHPDAERLINLVASGIAKIKADGTHNRIVSSHLNRIWSKL